MELCWIYRKELKKEDFKNYEMRVSCASVIGVYIALFYGLTPVLRQIREHEYENTKRAKAKVYQDEGRYDLYSKLGDGVTWLSN